MPPFHIPLGVSCDQISEHIFQEELELAEEIKSIFLSDLNIDASVDVVSRSLHYRNWVIDENAAFNLRGNFDKFAKLIQISKMYSQCDHYFSDTVCVNAATVWRWSTGKTRPSKLLGERLANELRCILISCVYDDIDLLSVRSREKSANLYLYKSINAQSKKPKEEEKNTAAKCKSFIPPHDN